MTEPPAKPRTLPPPACRLALRWSAWIGAAYAGALLAARAAVIYRFGGPVFSPQFLALVAVAELTAIVAWPLLAAFARTPARAAIVGATLQWSAVVLLAIYLFVCLTGLWDDANLQLIASMVAQDLTGGVR
jgi:hypothetical protein